MDKKEIEKIYVQSNVKSTWQIISELGLILGTFIGCFLFLYGEIKFLHGEIKSLDQKIESTNLQQSARTDRLYEMFIKLLQEKDKCK